MLSVTKIFEFEACHHLPNYDGACKNLHGHSYKLEVTVGGLINRDESSPKCGMIIDFKDLKALVDEVAVNKYDHTNLNQFFDCPTAENMVNTIAHDIIRELPDDLTLISCKLWETSTSYAEWHMTTLIP